MENEQKELAKVIEKYFGADAAYLDSDVFTLAKRIMEAGWKRPVRCKDCDKSKRSPLFGKGWRFCMNNSQHHKDEHFCSYGERGEEQ